MYAYTGAKPNENNKMYAYTGAKSNENNKMYAYTGAKPNENNKMYAYTGAKSNENNKMCASIGLFSFILALSLLRDVCSRVFMLGPAAGKPYLRLFICPNCHVFTYPHKTVIEPMKKT
jgi:hypothetical protein